MTISDTNLFKLKEFIYNDCSIDNKEISDIISWILFSNMSKTNVQVKMLFAFSWQNEKLDFYWKLFPWVLAVNEASEINCMRLTLFSKLQIPFKWGFSRMQVDEKWIIWKHEENLEMVIPDYISDKDLGKKLKNYVNYLQNNIIWLENVAIARLMAIPFLYDSFQNPFRIMTKQELKSVLDWLNPEEFINLTLDEIKENLEIHDKMCNYLDLNLVDDSEESILFNKILKSVISNRAYHLWDNLWFDSKLEMKECISVFYPNRYNLLIEDTQQKLWSCNRQKLSNIIWSRTFICWQCSEYKCPAKKRYTGDEKLVEEMHNKFPGREKTKKYFIERVIYIYKLIFWKEYILKRFSLSEEDYNKYISI